MSGIRYHHGDDGIVTLTLDDPDAPVNTMNEAFMVGLRSAVERLEQETDLVGVLLTSAKTSFFAGADLNRLRQSDAAQIEAETAYLDAMKADMRRLEKLGRPVVALVNGTALGGGFEVALLAHHRIALDAPGSRIGLPEVTLGLLPGAGGITRLTRLFGLVRALRTVILPGTRFRPREALEAGLVDEVVDDAADLEPRARAWIAAHPAPVKPWDDPQFRWPGGDSAPVLAELREELADLPTPAPRAALDAAVEGATVDADASFLIETRHLLGLTTGPVAKNMIKAFFFDLQHIRSGGTRPPVTAVHLVGTDPAVGQLAARAGIAVTEEAGLVVHLLGATDHLPQDDAVGLHLPAGGATPVIEVVRGARTKDDAVARAVRLVHQVRRTPIVVTDSPGFYADRLIGRLVAEIELAAGEGIALATVERAAIRAGYPAAVLQIHDRWDSGGDRVLPGDDLRDRLLLAPVLEAVRARDEGVVTSGPEANIGSLYGAGFPAWTGGVLQFVEQYEGGPAGFAARAEELAAAYGDRFRP